jgi:uncharacterized metal-binding protein YceD (DUF177 family)
MEQDSDFTAFSRTVEAVSVGPRGSERQIEATPAERAALAELLELLALDRLVATLSLRRLSSGIIEVKGRLEAEVVQQCVVSLEPVPAAVTDNFKVGYGEVDLGPNAADLDIDYEEADPPEPIVNGVIDLGAIVAEHLSLALDPYPRKPDASLAEEFKPETPEIAEEIQPTTRKPFSGLDKLIK